MSRKKISELTPVSKLTGSELVPLALGGQNYSFTPEQVREFVVGAVNNFTGSNRFQTGKFSVGDIAFTGSEEIRWNKNLAENWQRGLSWVNETAEASSVAVSGFINVGDKLGNRFHVSLNGDTSTTYSFGVDMLTVPDNISIHTVSGSRVIDQTTSTTQIGSTSKDVALYSGKSNLVHVRGATQYDIWDKYNLPSPAQKDVANTFTTTQTVKVTNTNIPIVMNYAASGATDVFVRLQLEGVSKGGVGYSTTAGTYLYNYEGTNFLGLFSDGAYVGKGSTKEKLLTEADITTLEEKITALEARIAALEGGQA